MSKKASVDTKTLESIGPDLVTLRQIVAENPSMAAVLDEHIKHLEAIEGAYVHSNDTIEGMVSSAEAVSATQREVLTKLFSEKLGKNVTFQYEIDPSLIGGYRVCVDDVVYDNSLKLQIQSIKKQLLNVEL